MELITSRFGNLEVRLEDTIHFPGGIIGFPAEKAFVLIPHGSSPLIAWLQSVTSPSLAFPVVSAHGFVREYPDVPLEQAADRAAIGGTTDDIALLAVLSAPRDQPATVNLLAPLLVNAATRTGAQVILEGSRFSTQELFAFPSEARPGEPSRAATGTAP